MEKTYKYHAPIGNVSTLVFNRELVIVEVQNPTLKAFGKYKDDIKEGMSIYSFVAIFSGGSKVNADIIKEKVTHTALTGERLYFEFRCSEPRDGADYYNRCHTASDDEGMIFCTLEPVPEPELYERRNRFMLGVLDQAINHINCGVILAKGKGKNRDNFILLINKKTAEMFECADGSLHSSTLWDSELSDRNNAKLLETEVDTCSYVQKLLNPDGSLRYYYNICKEIYPSHEGGYYIITTVTDLTSRYRREMKLKEMSKILEAVIKETGMKVWRYSFEEKKCHTCYGVVDDRFENKPFEETAKYYTAESLQVVRSGYADFASGKKSHDKVSVEMMDKETGQHEYIESEIFVSKWNRNGGALEIIGSNRDITVQKENLLRIEKMKEQNELILNNVNSDIIFFDKTFKVLWRNKQIHCLHPEPGCLQAYPEGEYCYDSTCGKGFPCQTCFVARTLQTMEVQVKKERIDGGVWEFTAIPVSNDDGTPHGVVMKIINVTLREEMMDTLVKAKTAAEKADKLKSIFLSNMSHEIRTPLNAIVGYSALMNDDTFSKTDKQEFYDIICTNTSTLMNIIGDILDLSRLEAGEIEIEKTVVNMEKFFDNMIATLRVHRLNVSSTVELSCVYPVDSHVCVETDSAKLRQILSNFATNAMKYTSNGYVHMGYEYRDGGIYVFVEDTGIGINKESLGMIFNRFEKLNSHIQGTGLGLSICKQLVDALGGKIGVESDPAVRPGSRFWAWIPCRRC